MLTHDKLDEFKALDGYLFGIPTRYGMMCAQMKAFFDSTGGASLKAPAGDKRRRVA